MTKPLKSQEEKNLSVPTVSGLLVMGGDPGERIAGFLRAIGVEPVTAPNCGEARLLLAGTSVCVVLAEDKLPDGDWRSVLEEVGRQQVNVEVIVCSRLGDSHLWCEVLQSGAYDLLTEPYDAGEIQRVVESAVLRALRRPATGRPGKHLFPRPNGFTGRAV